MGGVSGPGLKPSCLGMACIDDEMGTIGVEIGDASVVVNTVVGAPTTGATLGGKMLES